MSTTGGPNKVVDSGLVLSLDAANDKSFRGEPTENLASSFSSKHRTWRRRGSGGAPLNIISDNKVRVDISVTEEQNSDSWLYYPSYQSAISGQSYTWTLYVEELFEYKATQSEQFYIQVRDSSNSIISQLRVNEIKKGDVLSISFVNPTGNTSFGRVSFGFGGGLRTSDRLHGVFKFQLEQKPYATPFVGGTRGPSVATGGGWVDRSKNENHGTLVNEPTFNSLNSGSIEFDGSDDRISIPNPLNQNNLNQIWTISAWVNVDNNNVHQQLITGFNAGINLNHVTTNRPLLYLNSGVNDYYIYGQSGRILGKGWLYITFAFRNSDGFRKIYLNDAEDISSHGPNRTSTPSGLSSTFNIASSMSGKLSQIQIYNRLLSTQEIKQNFNATKGRYDL